MPCEHCLNKRVKHTLSTCLSIAPLVDACYTKMEIDYKQFTDYNELNDWVSQLSTPVLKRLVKRLNEKMTQTRQELEKVVFKRLLNNIIKHLYQELNLYRIHPDLNIRIKGFQHIYSFVLRFMELYKLYSHPFALTKFYRGIRISASTIEKEANTEKIQSNIKDRDQLNNLLTTLTQLRTYIKDYENEKCRLVLYRTGFNRDVFRHIVSFL